MAQSPKRKEAPVEPFKRALAICVRSIAADDKVEVSYASGPPAMDGKSIKLPEPPRIPSKNEIAVLRGQADSLALTAACHDPKVHSRLAPGSGPARAVFEAAERARIEALGSLRMPGMANNIAAKIESHYGTRYADVSERAQAPLEDALALLVRERLTGREPPKGAKKLVELWRDLDRGARRRRARRDGNPRRGPAAVRPAAFGSPEARSTSSPRMPMATGRVTTASPRPMPIRKTRKARTKARTRRNRIARASRR